MPWMEAGITANNESLHTGGGLGVSANASSAGFANSLGVLGQAHRFVWMLGLGVGLCTSSLGRLELLPMHRLSSSSVGIQLVPR